jgi:hypothetical protein
MTASQKRPQRRANPSDVPLVSISTSPAVEGVGVRDTVINDDFARRRANNLDAEAAYYRHRAIQEEQALGPGYYVDLFREMATDRAAMAQRIRIRDGVTG